MQKISAINIAGSIILCLFVVVYIHPFFDREFIQEFSRQYAEVILLAFLIFTIINKLISSRKKLELLFWSLICGAFLSWFIMKLLRLFMQEQFTNTNLDFSAWISYFLFYALMITAIEVKSFSDASRLYNQRSLITSMSILTFLIGSFTYLILLPVESNIEVSSNLQEPLFFYILMASYLVLRWWHLAWQLKSISASGFFMMGLASLNWMFGDILEYLLLTEENQLNALWFDWVWYLPYLFFFIGIQQNLKNDNQKRMLSSFSRYHLFNSPIFFLGLISILFLIESNINSFTKEAPLQSVQIVWLFVTLTLAFFQIIELFDTNKKRKSEFKEIGSLNSLIVQQLEQCTLQLESQTTANKVILNTISNPIFTLQLDGTIIATNLATYQLLGYPEKQLIGRCFSELIPQDEEFHHFFDYQSYRQQLSKNKKGLELESSVLTHSNEQIAVHVTISQGLSSFRNRLIISLADIRQQKKAEQQLHSLKDEFMANISHEFRTPLTIVNGVIDDLLSSQSETASLQQLQIAKRNNLRLIHMVDQLLEISRIASETLPISDVDASEWVKLICQSYNTIAKDREIDYGYSICPNIFIRGNQKAFEDILYNLLSNAFKYTPKGGSVNILLTEQEQDYLLTVADTGIGISKEEQSNIFNRFQRSEINDQHSIPGTGIGLSLVKDLVNAMNWEISLESKLNKGSKFIVQMKKAITDKLTKKPLTENNLCDQQVSFLKADINQLDSNTILSRSKYLVLIIEDNLDMQRHLDNILNPHHQCLIASNGTQGLNMAEEFLPDIVISDVMMPGIDGFEVLAKLKQQPFTTHIPVIMLTAKSDQKSKIIGLSAEADDYLTKPFDAEELLLKINNQLNVRKKLQQKYESQWQGSTQTEPDEVKETIENPFLMELNRIFEHIYPQADYSMNLLASELAMSERQLQRKIKALVDISPLELLKRFRLEKSKIELKQNTQIGLVAQSCGFSSQTYFGRCFKEHFAITPKAYQQQER